MSEAEFFIGKSESGHRDLAYYRVIPGVGATKWERNSETPEMVSVYDVWMHDREGGGLREVERSDTPWGDG